MIPMERGRIFKILTEIFPDDGVWREEYGIPYIMKEDASNPHDINFVRSDNTHLNGYHDIDYWLRIIDPRDDCPEYNLVLHSAISDKDANIAIDGVGNYRIYGDEINSIILTTIKNNIQKFCEYVKELTCAEQKLVFDKVVCVVSTFCEKLMNEHASTFDQLDMTVDRDDCKFFYVRSLNSPHMNFQFDVVSHIDTVSIPNNEVWVRFSVASGSLWTPITINPYIGQVVIHAEIEQPVFTGSFTTKQLVELATKIREATGFVVCCNEGASDKSQSRSIYIRRMLEKSDELSRLKESVININSAINAMEDKMIGCDEVFQVVVDWLHAMSSCDRIKDVRHVCYTHHTLSVSNSVGCGASKQYVTEELEVSYTLYMKSIMISLGKEHIITIDYLGLGDKSTCVYIMKYNQKGIDDVLNKYLVACLAEVLKDRLGMDKLRAYTTVKCTQYTELTHNGPCFFNDDGMTAYVIDPNNVISNENINKNNKANTILDMEAHIDDLIDKKIRKLVESGSMLYTSKDYMTDQIFSQLKNGWQKNVYISVYSAVWCTLAESRFKSAAFELEKHFMEYVTLDNDDCFTVIFGLQRIDDNLPGIEINFYSATEEIVVRMLDHKASGSGTWSRPLIRLRPSFESIVYFDKIKNTNCTYKSFLANVVSKIVLLEGLS